MSEQGNRPTELSHSNTSPSNEQADKVMRMRDLTIPSDWDQMVEETQTDLTTTVRPG